MKEFRMKRRLAVLLVIWLVGGYSVAIGQTTRCKGVNDQWYISDTKERPKLAVDLTQVAKFKLSSRKAAYRFGELISLDMAMLNVSGEPLFFDNPSASFQLMIEVRDEAGREIEV